MDGILLIRGMNWSRKGIHLIRATISTSAVVQRGGSAADLARDGLGSQWRG